MQPIRKAIDYKKYFSNELNNLLDNMMSSMKNENPVSEITTEFFLMYALETQDCMLYKVVNNFLNSFTIDTIHSTFYLNVQDNLLSGIRPGRAIDYSVDFMNYLSKSYDEKEKLKCKLITSDHILLAILNDKQNSKAKDIFLQNGLNYNTLLDKATSLHEITDSIVSNEDDEEEIPSIQIIATGADIMNGGIIKQVQTLLPTMMQGNGNKRQNKKTSKTQIQFCTCLNNLAETGKIDGIVGRDEEIKKLEKIFARRRCNNAVIVGKSGVGKTALIEGLAKMIVDRTAPLSLLNCKVFSLNINSIISGANLRGMLEERINKVFGELKSVGNAILFIDDAHNLISEKKNDEYGFVEAVSEHLTNDSIRIVLSTTEKGYKTILSAGQNVARKFQKITIEGTNETDTKIILENVKKHYEMYHGVTYNSEIISSVVSLSKRYIPEISLPSSAIDIIDEVGALRKLKIKENDFLKEKMLTLSNLKSEKDLAIKRDDINVSKRLDDDIAQITNEIAIYVASMENPSEEVKAVTVDDVYEAISQHTDIPVSKINVSEKKTLSDIANTLKSKIVGQDKALDSISNAIKRSKVGLYPTNKPISTFLLLGSSGVGKSLTAKTLATEIFGDEKYLVRFDMSEYSDKTSVNKLIGAGSGYVGYDNGGLLTEAIKNKKHAVLLIDEIEKADEQVFNLFLQVFDDGFLTDNQGNKVDFKNTIILLTSNVGAREASLNNGIGFNINTNDNKKNIITKELKHKFPPEFINRIDEIIYYNELTDDNLNNIIKLELSKLEKRVNNLKYGFDYTDDVIDHIFNIVTKEKEYGARPIVRAIQNEIETKITDYILDNEEIANIMVSVDNGGIKIAD